VTKLDLKKELKHLYNPSANNVAVVEIPPASFLMIDGSGDPNTSPEYKDALEALYPLAYAMKFKIKKNDPALDYAVMPLEGLWWVDGMRRFSLSDKASWKWTMMIMQPVELTDALLAEIATEVARKKRLLRLQDVRLAPYHEGLAAQIMHIGPYAAEEPTITKLHAFIEEHSYRRRGKHHEIYLKDPNRTEPQKLLTIIRQPIE
jgi:hypothetical protein